jgi:hypothetical protein
MPEAPDLLAAELAAIRGRGETPLPRITSLPISHPAAQALMASAADVRRLLAAVERINALADQWHGERGNDYSASALYASKLREVLEEELLSEGESENG